MPSARAGARATDTPASSTRRRSTAIYEQALTILFRLLFVAYAEDKDLLPYRTNGAYRDHALKTMARELAERRAVGAARLRRERDRPVGRRRRSLAAPSTRATSSGACRPTTAASSRPTRRVNAAGAALASLTLTNAEFGPALAALLVDESEDGVLGPVDFRSLSVREFGTIYEGLLESSLSVAPDRPHPRRQAQLRACSDGDEVVVEAGDVYFHNRSGARKATGSYFTKPFAVEHLLDHALEPALDDHLARVLELVDAGEDGEGGRGVLRLPLRRPRDGLRPLPRRRGRPHRGAAVRRSSRCTRFRR